MDSFSAACIVATFTVTVLVVAALFATLFATSADGSGDDGAFLTPVAVARVLGSAATSPPPPPPPPPPPSTPTPQSQVEVHPFVPSASADAAADPLARDAHPTAPLTDRVNLAAAPEPDTANYEAGSGGRAAGAHASVHANVQEALRPRATQQLASQPSKARGHSKPSRPRYSSTRLARPRHPSARLARPSNAPEVLRRRALAQFPPRGRRGANPALPPLRRSNAVRVPSRRRSARVLTVVSSSVHG